MVAEDAQHVRVILTTAGRDEGPEIARHLVEKRLAACVNITEVTSYYRWEGRFCQDAETSPATGRRGRARLRRGSR